MITLLIIIVALIVIGAFFLNFVSLAFTLLWGLAAGALARWIMPGEQKMDWLQTMLLGVLGSILGAFVGAVTGIAFLGPVLSVLGSLALLWAWLALRKRADSKWPSPRTNRGQRR